MGSIDPNAPQSFEETTSKPTPQTSIKGEGFGRTITHSQSDQLNETAKSTQQSAAASQEVLDHTLSNAPQSLDVQAKHINQKQETEAKVHNKGMEEILLSKSDENEQALELTPEENLVLASGHGMLMDEDAAKLLKDEPPGSFLVADSPLEDGGSMIFFKAKSGAIENLLCNPTNEPENGFEVMHGDSLDFIKGDSLAAILVAKSLNNPIMPSPTPTSEELPGDEKKLEKPTSAPSISPEEMLVFEKKFNSASGHGQLYNYQAVDLLKDKPVGSFLVADSPFEDVTESFIYYVNSSNLVEKLQCEATDSPQFGYNVHKPDLTTVFVPGFSMTAIIAHPEFSKILTEPVPSQPKATTTTAVTEAPEEIKENEVPQSPKPIPRNEKIIRINPQIDWNIKPYTPSPDEVDQASPEKLLGMLASGAQIRADQLMKAADKLHTTLTEALVKDPSVGTTLHLLYDKAAEKYMDEGNLEKAYAARKAAAENVPITESHPMYRMDKAIEEGSNRQSNPNFGAHFSSRDTGAVKGGNIRAWTRNVEGKPTHCFDFKLSKHTRNDLQNNIELMKNNMAAFESSLPDALKGGVTITRDFFRIKGPKSSGEFTSDKSFSYNPLSYSWQIEFKGVGKITIGDDNSMGCQSNEVYIELEAGKKDGETLKALHQILSVLGCGPIIGEQRKEDDDRMQIAQIFRTFYPREAIKMEQSKEFYELPVEMLKQQIETQVPEMKEKFEKYFNTGLMKKEEIYPGRSVWTMTDLGQQVKEKGAFGLMAGVKDAERACKMLQVGALSSQDRLQAGIMFTGASTREDLGAGGGDQVYTRMVTNKIKETEISKFTFSGSVQVLFDINVVNRGAYGYKSDCFGCKNIHDVFYDEYKNRGNMMEFAENLQPRGAGENEENEVMIKNRIGPEFIRACVVGSEKDKEELQKKMCEEKLVKDRSGVPLTYEQLQGDPSLEGFVNGRPFKDFIKVGAKFTQDMWG